MYRTVFIHLRKINVKFRAYLLFLSIYKSLHVFCFSFHSIFDESKVWQFTRTEISYIVRQCQWRKVLIKPLKPMLWSIFKMGLICIRRNEFVWKKIVFFPFLSFKTLFQSDTEPIPFYDTAATNIFYELQTVTFPLIFGSKTRVFFLRAF